MSYRTSKIYQGPASGGAGGTGGGGLLETTFDITGVTDINMVTLNAYDIINLTSGNAAETIGSISNLLSNKKKVFRVITGALTVQFMDKTVFPGPGNLKLQAGTLDVLGSKLGYIEMQSRVIAGDVYQIDYLDQYV